jgi:hypothetical protein
MIKIDVKVKDDKYVEMEEVPIKHLLVRRYEHNNSGRTLYIWSHNRTYYKDEHYGWLQHMNSLAV